jgi:hypothetical protein
MPICKSFVVINGVLDYCGKRATRKWYGGYYCRRHDPGRSDSRFPSEPAASQERLL